MNLHIYSYKYIDYFNINSNLYHSAVFHSIIVLKDISLLIPNTFNMILFVAVYYSTVKNVLQGVISCFPADGH